jgi:hypothetical protein
MKTFTRQKDLLAGCLSLATGKAALQQHKRNTDTIKLNRVELGYDFTEGIE